MPDFSFWMTLFIGLGTTTIGYLLNRAINALDADLKEHEEKINLHRDNIEGIRINIAQNYVSKTDLKEQLESQLKPLRDSIGKVEQGIADLNDYLRGGPKPRNRRLTSPVNPSPQYFYGSRDAHAPRQYGRRHVRHTYAQRH